MKAICVTPDRVLELREIPTPTEPPPGYLLVDIEACAINLGDKTFLKSPQVAGGKLDARVHDVWGASASGRVVAVGPGVPLAYAGSQVAIYRGLQRDLPVLGLWCERAQVPYRTCLPLSQHLSTKEYSGSLVNVMTAYAFLEQAVAEGHAGVIATAGNSATGLALAALARRRRIPAIFLVRTPAARAELQRRGIEHVIVNQEGGELADLAARLGATAVFDERQCECGFALKMFTALAANNDPAHILGEGCVMLQQHGLADTAKASQSDVAREDGESTEVPVKARELGGPVRQVGWV